MIYILCILLCFRNLIGVCTASVILHEAEFEVIFQESETVGLLCAV